jgi:hypothetical protein
MFMRWNPITRKWEVPFAHHESEKPGEGDGAAASGGKPTVDAAKLAEENTALKKQLADMTPRIQAVEEAEKKRVEKATKDAEDKRKKDLGVDVILAEKDEALKKATARLDEIEKKESERVDAEFAALPDDVRKAIEPMKGKLELSDWVDLVERHKELAGTIEERETSKGGSVFFQPGGAGGSSEYKISRKGAEILEQVGHTQDMIKKLQVEQVVDEKSKQLTTRFTRPLRTFFGDMQKPERYKVKVNQGR